jgi:Zn-finger nucleic acid-binding protein
MRGGGPFRHDPSAPATPGPCPRCPDVELEPRAHGAIELAVCRACRGSWVGKSGVVDLLTATDEDLLGLVRHEHRSAPDERARRRPAGVVPIDDADVLPSLRCPRCAIEMQRQETASGAAVDVCPRHGIWFDTAELGPFLAYILAMGGPL